jgi:uncharacterized DUF497 family protein
MDIVFDPAKNESNLAKHGVSLEAAADLDVLAVVEDDRFAERRFRLYGLLDGKPHCLAAALNDGIVRAISFRRAHAKEYRRHVG